MGGTLIKIGIGHGRGWLAPAPAASLRRIDAHMLRVLGRVADINEAGRSPEQANENRRKWLAYARYLNGGPWAPKAAYALGAEDSVHCWGGAADSDDWYNATAAAIWREHGWLQTARYPGNKSKDEPWHGEHFLHLDRHRNDPAPSGGGSKPAPKPVPKPTPEPILEEDEDMPQVSKRADKDEWTLHDPDIGLDLPEFVYGVTPKHRSTKVGGGVVNVYRGFMVTTDPSRGAAWCRTWCRPYGNAPLVREAVDYGLGQAESSRFSVEKHRG